MLKVCWDCCMGTNRDTENTNHSNINENFHSVHWTSRSQTNMFRLPKPIDILNNIEIFGELRRKESIFFGLYNDYNSPVGKLEINFLDKCTYEYKDDGHKTQISDMDPSDLFTDSNFTLSLKVAEVKTDNNEYVIDVCIEPSYLCSLYVNNISSISYFQLSDDVNVRKLCFDYQKIQ